MIEKKTVFIIGAGASHEIKFPLGSGLCEQIRKECEVLIKDLQSSHFYNRGTLADKIYQHFQETKSLADIIDTVTRIRENVCVPASLDEYLNTNDSEINLFICKTLVVKIIGKSETETIHELHSEKYSRSYYPKLWRLLITGVTKDNIANIFKNVSFIIFNYDRSLENYFYEKLQYFEFLDDEARINIMRSIYIHHPYGQIGKLPWQDNPNQDTVLHYGAVVNPNSWTEILPQIRTYREEISDNTSVEESRRRLKEAEQIVFLGFGFHNQNMELLRYEQVNFNSKPIFLTTMGKVSDNTYEKMKICKKIIDVFNFEKSQYSNNSFNNFYPAESCSALFDTYERGIL